MVYWEQILLLCVVLIQVKGCLFDGGDPRQEHNIQVVEELVVYMLEHKQDLFSINHDLTT